MEKATSIKMAETPETPEETVIHWSRGNKHSLEPSSASNNTAEVTAAQELAKKGKRGLLELLKLNSEDDWREWNGSPSETSSRHYRSSPESEKDKREIKFKDIPRFALNFNLQKHQEWITDLEYIFRGAPKKYSSEERKILAAISYMDPAYRQRWYRFVDDKSPEERRFLEKS
ncbi:hypothetical protein BO70DRAFT_431998 [Aspergillus heteromorphus CBS 117.55]|uniref:Uncharacterized protein n=1 Tax=Aspergillus heteromorphus CBS 117.55 TaxID=1448321 RepID=A0A317VD16_9EURO|nr:uncharacterized protein BO70DRAFT_431998 [Aspergillus heteromorphus CBS 117.55]PWY70898.1 hypothetical protein BO70DRAFT_431998 [Aspergillus heteromorphus CBS 117.55]